MTKRLRVSLSGMLCFILLMTGCARPQLDPHLLLEDPLWRAVNLGPVQTRMNDQNFLEIQLQGLNRRGHRQQLQYSVVFFDQDGYQVETILSRWTSLNVEEHGTFAIKAVAPNANVTNYQIKLREAR